MIPRRRAAGQSPPRDSLPKPEFAIAYAVSVIATLALRWSQLDMPLFYGDEFLFSRAPWHFHQTHFHLLGNPGDMEIFHPPLYYAFLAILTLTFGWKMRVLHGAALLMSSLIVATIYALARRHAGRIASTAAAAGFFLSTMHLSRAISIEPDFSGAAFGLLALWSLLENSPRRGSMFFAASCLCNGPAIIFAPCFAYALSRRIPGQRLGPALIRFFAPSFLGLSAWCAYFLFAMPGVEDLFVGEQNFAFLRGAQHVLERLLKIWPQNFFIDSGRSIVSLAILWWIAGLLRSRHNRARKDRDIDEDCRVVFGMILIQFLFLVFFGLPAQHYAATSIALIYALGAWALTDIKAGLSVQVGVLALASTLGLRTWSLPRAAANVGYGSYHSNYIDSVRGLMELAKELGKEPPGAVIYTHWPLDLALESERSGYAARGFSIVGINEDPDKIPIPVTAGKKALLLFESPADPPTPDYPGAAIAELRKRTAGACRSWERPYSKFFLCPLDY